MTKVICFANNKGGSGKSTTCSNIAYALTQLGKKVLIVDCDMQSNLTLSYFSEDETMEFSEGKANLYEVLIHDKPAQDCIRKTVYENLDLLPSSAAMSGAEHELYQKPQNEFVLRNALKEVKESGVYDFILMDSPPTLGYLVRNVLAASDYLIIPLESSPWGLFGLANMFDFLKEMQKKSPNLELLGVLVTKVDTRKNYYKQTIDALSGLENVRIFQNVVRLDSNIEWAQDNSKPVMAFKRSCRSAREYMEVSKEMIEYADR